MPLTIPERRVSHEHRACVPFFRLNPTMVLFCAAPHGCDVSLYLQTAHHARRLLEAPHVVAARSFESATWCVFVFCFEAVRCAE